MYVTHKLFLFEFRTCGVHVIVLIDITVSTTFFVMVENQLTNSKRVKFNRQTQTKEPNHFGEAAAENKTGD